MRVQRVVMPDGAESRTLLDDQGVPVPPAEAYLAHLQALDRSPATVRAYATSLKLWWVFLHRVGVGFDEASVEQVSRFVEWLRAPAENVAVLDGGDARVTAAPGPGTSAHCAAPRPHCAHSPIAAIRSPSTTRHASPAYPVPGSTNNLSCSRRSTGYVSSRRAAAAHALARASEQPSTHYVSSSTPTAKRSPACAPRTKHSPSSSRTSSAPPGPPRPPADTDPSRTCPQRPTPAITRRRAKTIKIRRVLCAPRLISQARHAAQIGGFGRPVGIDGLPVNSRTLYVERCLAPHALTRSVSPVPGAAPSDSSSWTVPWTHRPQWTVRRHEEPRPARAQADRCRTGL
jgi:hypothetical protein